MYVNIRTDNNNNNNNNNKYATCTTYEQPFTGMIALILYPLPLFLMEISFLFFIFFYPLFFWNECRA